MISAFRNLLLALLLLASGAAATQAWGQGTNAPGPPSIVSEQRSAIDRLAGRAKDVENAIAANADDDAKLTLLRSQLDVIERELLAASVAFRPRLNDINARIEQLGPASTDPNAPEPEAVTRERQSLIAEKAEINAALGNAEDLSIRVSTLIGRITDMRRDLFARLLTRRYEINVALVGEVVDAARAQSFQLYRSVAAWLRFVLNFKLNSVLAATFFALIAAAVLLMGGRRLFGRLIEADPGAKQPSYLSRLSVAFWSTLLPTAAVAVFLAATYFFFDTFQVLRGDIGTVLAALFTVVGLVFFVHRLGSAILCPKLPEWRLIPVRSSAASRLLGIMSTTAVVSGIDVFLSRVYETFDAPLALTVAEALVATVLIGLLVILAGLVKPFSNPDETPRAWPMPVRIFLIGLGLVTILAAFSGYVGMARFISLQIVWTGAVLTTMYIGFLSSRTVSQEGAFAGTAVGVRVQSALGLDGPMLDQFSVALSIVINIIVLIVGAPLILFGWGFQPGDMSAWAYRVATGVRVGNFTLSLTGILWGLIVFGLLTFLTRWFQRWLDGSVLARGKVDSGVRNSIRTVIGYAGIAIALMIGISAAGIDLSSFALIAGGLSLGIGFGLQNVVSNFVSGLILLAERPFKAGDWIVAGEVSGTVKKISVRATEIETFQRQSVILPNSELINRAVGNWTHRNKLGRLDVKLGVAYGTNVRRVHEVLIEIARAHPMVLKNPEPFALFANFGASALEFEIRVFLADILNGGIVQNDLRFAILEAFAREGIEIPSAPRYQDPVRERWPADDDAAEAELVHAADRKVEADIRKRQPRQLRRVDPDPDSD